ncbi:MAG: indolepyruvate ferredoxin oxidoreductase subunit alpha [Desulfuromonadales bacterium]|nr:indolepyruvate ferredoxin oxidoreductase subunit alpha [Desulfuromonadales bacterium]
MTDLFLMGNEAIARGLIEAGCTLASAYPGTPSTEILQAVVNFRDLAVDPLHIEWSVNEKIAFEVALAHSYTGKRAAVAMKQVGLNVAADPFMRTAYLGVKGGLVLIVADDPGPHSSQNEQDSRQFAQFARIPVLDPASPAEAREMVVEAFALSEELELPVMLRPTTRICHARQNLASREPQAFGRKADFRKEPGRWAATPAFLPALHRALNEKIDRLAVDERFRPQVTSGDGSFPGMCVVAAGICFATAADRLEAQGLLGSVDLCQVRMPYPLHAGFIAELKQRYQRVLLLEETYPVIEAQLGHPGLSGRSDGTVPREGELTPDIIAAALDQFLGRPHPEEDSLPVAPGRRPSLCPGCPHRAAFHAIKMLFPKGIFPSDIGCYTLGLNLGAVDTVHCMGACISQGAGFYHAYAQDGGEVPPIVVTIGDSTFFHAGIPALINAVIQQARIVVVILDNATTAMTGHQPVPHLGLAADGSKAPAVPIENLVRACGVRFIAEGSPYDRAAFEQMLRDAHAHTRAVDGGVAVVISRHPCLMDRRACLNQKRYRMQVETSCTGCRRCLKQFECAAIVFNEATSKATIDPDLCVGCGTCVPACPVGAIVAIEEEAP